MNNDQTYQDLEAEPKAGSLGLPDIYYVLFRRKWLVLVGLVLGVVAAAGLWHFKQPLYQSYAKLMVLYVKDSSMSTVLVGSGAEVRRPTTGNANVTLSEAEIFNSLDSARDVAAAIKDPRLVPKGWPANNPSLAAGFILKNLRVETSPSSDMIKLHFQHPVPQLSSNVLALMIKEYLKKHEQIHSIGLEGRQFVEQTNYLQTRLTEIDLRLNVLRTNLGSYTLDDFRKSRADYESKLRKDLTDAQGELAKKAAMLRVLQANLQGRPASNGAPAAISLSPTTADVSAYATICKRVSDLELKEYDLLGRYTEANAIFQANHGQLEAARREQKQMELAHPELTRASVLPQAVPGVLPPTIDLNQRQAEVAAAEAHIYSLSNAWELARQEGRRVDELAPEMEALETEKKQLAPQLETLQRRSIEKQFEKQLDSPNIRILVSPSVPDRDFMQLYKKMAMILFGGLAAGIALAFLMEMVVDRTLKRPKDVETHLHLPLLLSIPKLALGGDRKLLPRPENGVAHSGNHSDDFLGKNGNGGPDTTEVESEMRPYHDALRDRLVHYFDIRDMTHKPKMIAVTSCDDRAGVSSIASGLAASLSETGDGNVLLVDMRGDRGAAQAFHLGKPACGLEQALENDSRSDALVHEHLYVVSAGSSDKKLHKILPRQFGDYVPKLKASDYDYIIFDMPPVVQTSITAKVARFMDMVLMVVESDGTDRDVAARAGALLTESKATVGMILNKRRRYVPAWLHQEFH